MAQVHDDGFHEIQLNGKQLVFLFMAATVVSVVIFLCGVLVGRGVRAERSVADNAPTSVVAETTPQPATPPPAPPTPAGSDPRAAAPPPASDDLTYFDRLEKQKTPKEQLKPAAQKNTPERPAVAPPPKAKETPRTATTEPASLEPTGPGYAVQIAALNVRGEAEAIARRLSSKGYSAYVLSPPNGTPAVFRVRVGKFSSRREAESIAAKLKKEEQFNPWVTR